MKYTVSKTFSFEAAHSLPHLPVGHKCRNLHGHSYVVEVFVSGPLDKRGFVVDYSEINDAMAPLIKYLDHQNLNDLLFPMATTAENLGAWILGRLLLEQKSIMDSAGLGHLGRGYQIWVDVHETAKTCVRVTV